jgi:hypothetical protein
VSTNPRELQWARDVGCELELPRAALGSDRGEDELVARAEYSLDEEHANGIRLARKCRKKEALVSSAS